MSYTVHFDKFDLLNFIEGQAFGSHLRQHIWRQCVNEFYPQLTDEDRNFVYHYFMRDCAERLFERTHHRYCHDDIRIFIDRFDPDNQYKVTARYQCNGKMKQITAECFKGTYPIRYAGEDAPTLRTHYYMEFNRFFDEKYVKKIVKLETRSKLYHEGEHRFNDKEREEIMELRKRISNNKE